MSTRQLALCIMLLTIWFALAGNSNSEEYCVHIKFVKYMHDCKLYDPQVFEVRSTDELTEEYLVSKLKFFRWSRSIVCQS